MQQGSFLFHKSFNDENINKNNKTCLGPNIFAMFSRSVGFPFVDITVDLFLEKFKRNIYLVHCIHLYLVFSCSDLFLFNT